MPIQVLLYEDNENLRQSIATLFNWNAEYHLVAALLDASNVLADLKVYLPDVILMDIDMPKSNGVDTVKRLRMVTDSLPIIMFTMFDKNESIFNSNCAGANGYLLKRKFDQIPAAIKDVLDGCAPMKSSVAKKVLTFVPKNQPQKLADPENLSKRESEILTLVAKGFIYKMVCSQLVISTEMVRTHLKHIYIKLQVNNATGSVHNFLQGTYFCSQSPFRGIVGASYNSHICVVNNLKKIKKHHLDEKQSFLSFLPFSRIYFTVFVQI